jgi:hypothetical protein
MKVVGYCVSPPPTSGFSPMPEHWAPCIPVGLATEGGLVFLSEYENRDKPSFHRVQLKDPVEVPDGSWLGIEMDGSCTVLARGEEAEWRVTRATKAIQSLANRPASMSAMRLVSAMHAGAHLIGIRISDLQSALTKARKSPQEPLEVTVRAVAAELGRLR